MKIPLQKIVDSQVSSLGIDLFILRLDKTHSHSSGNKWYKLKYNLEEAKKQNKNTLLTFGGAFSNHLSATAAAGKEYGFNTIGIIRGDELTGEENSTLRFAKDSGMKLHFVSREEYRKKSTPEFNEGLKKQFGNFYLLPEGGTNDLAVAGCREILDSVTIPFDFICCAVGTGGTLAGIISSLKKNQKAIGFSVLKGAQFLSNEVNTLLKFPSHISNWEIQQEYHFGGYAKYTPELLKFIADFEKQNSIPLDQVYTGKMMYGIYDMVRQNYFQKGSVVIAIHTGGLQGRLPSFSAE